jgi:hypothetical protein
VKGGSRSDNTRMNCEYIERSALYETEELCCAKEEDGKAASYTAALVKIKVFCAMTPFKLVNSYRPLGGALCVCFQGSTRRDKSYSSRNNLKTRTLSFFESSETIYQVARRHVPENLNF